MVMIDYDSLCDMDNEDLIEYIGELQAEVSMLNARLEIVNNKSSDKEQ